VWLLDGRFGSSSAWELWNSGRRATGQVEGHFGLAALAAELRSGHGAKQVHAPEGVEEEAHEEYGIEQAEGNSREMLYEEALVVSDVYEVAATVDRVGLSEGRLG